MPHMISVAAADTEVERGEEMLVIGQLTIHRHNSS